MMLLVDLEKYDAGMAAWAAEWRKKLSSNSAGAKTKVTTMAKYKLNLTLVKTNQETGEVEDQVCVSSQNLSLDETIKMRAPLIDVLAGWNKEDAE